MNDSRVELHIDSVTLHGDLVVPEDAKGVVIFAHGSGSSRLSPRNRAVAGVIRHAGIGTLLFDLLTQEEEARDALTAELRFNIAFLARRLHAVSEWMRGQRRSQPLPIGYFGASTGAAAAIAAAAEYPEGIAAVVSRGGRPDLAGDALPRLRAPTLLLVGGNDAPVIQLNQQALARLNCEKQLTIIPGAGHLFEEPGTLDQVARLATDWFERHFESATLPPVRNHLPRCG